MRRRRIPTALVAVVVLGVIALLTALVLLNTNRPDASGPLGPSSGTTAPAAPGAGGSGAGATETPTPVTTAYGHVQQFQALADEYGDRAAGSPGYEAAARYVEGQLQLAGYETSRHYFTYWTWNEEEEEEEEFESFSVIAETAGGDGDNVVMMGAHLDGVPGAAAINDNGSGSAALLVAAQRLAEEQGQQATGQPTQGSSAPSTAPSSGQASGTSTSSATVANKVRFVWWGAEEIRGYPGSRSYVEELEDNDELDTIAAYLNFDMVASPNHVIALYDAHDTESRRDVPEGSTEVMKVLSDFFDSRNEPWTTTEWDYQSDQVAFVEADVPTGGLFTGADETKTRRDVSLFGGEAGRPRDPNYHQSGDDLGNVDRQTLELSTDAIANAASRLASDPSLLEQQ
jgi:Zn-dependent M28 family amino/carboxypeptidase